MTRVYFEDFRESVDDVTNTLSEMGEQDTLLVLDQVLALRDAINGAADRALKFARKQSGLEGVDVD